MVYETSVSTKAFFYYKNPAKNLNKQTMEVNIRRVEENPTIFTKSMMTFRKHITLFLNR